MNSKRMLNSDVMFNNAVSKLSDKAFRLYINLMLFADDDGVVSSINNAKLVSGGAEECNLDQLAEVGLISQLDEDGVLIMDWLRHNRLSKKTYQHKAPQMYRDRIRVDVNGRYVLDDDKSELPTLNEYWESKTVRRDTKEENAMK